MNAAEFKISHPDTWDDADAVNGKLYRFVDVVAGVPLIEIRADERPKLEGFEIFEPDWVVAQAPTVFAIYDTRDQIIFGPQGVSDGYSLLSLLQIHGYASVDAFYEEQTPGTGPRLAYDDMDIWLRLGLRVKVYIPSLRRKETR